MIKRIFYTFFFICCLIILGIIFFQSSSKKPVSENIHILTSFEFPQLSAESAYSIYIGPEENIDIVSHNAHIQRPIASISKLMTAWVVMKYSLHSQIIKISEAAYAQFGDTPGIVPGAQFRGEDLLYPLLINSSNDVAYAFAEHIGFENFVSFMNREAQTMGLSDTVFYNPSGLDDTNLNLSNAQDLVRLANHILTFEPKIFTITTHPVYSYGNTSDESFNLLNTNILLFDEIYAQRIIGAKTGETPKAKQALLLIEKEKIGHSIHVILYSENRFDDMIKLINTLQ